VGGSQSGGGKKSNTLGKRLLLAQKRDVQHWDTHTTTKKKKKKKKKGCPVVREDHKNDPAWGEFGRSEGGKKKPSLQNEKKNTH